MALFRRPHLLPLSVFCLLLSYLGKLLNGEWEDLPPSTLSFLSLPLSLLGGFPGEIFSDSYDAPTLWVPIQPNILNVIT